MNSAFLQILEGGIIVNRWKEIETKINSIEDMSQFNSYIFKTITQALITVFPNSIIEETAFNNSRLFFDFFIDLREMRLFVDIKHSKDLIIEFWEKQLPIILSQLSNVKEKERKKTKFLLIYIESNEPLESFGIEINSPNLLIISLKHLIEIQNQIQLHSDKLFVFEVLINYLSGFITENFVEAYIKFLMIYENFDPSKFYYSLKEFLKNINATLLIIRNQEILDNYDISIQFPSEKIKIINALLEREPLKLLEISKTVNISEELTSLILFYFINENIFKPNREANFSFKIGIAPFKRILQYIFYLEDKTFLINLYKSVYLQRSLSSLVEYTKDRFFLREEDNSEEIKKLIELFPSVLFYCIFEEKRLGFFKNASKDKNFNTYNAFKDDIFSKIIEDLFKNKDLMKDIFVYNKISDYKFLGNMILLKEAKQFLDFKTEKTISIVKLKEDVSLEAGMPIFLPDSNQLVNLVAKAIQLKDYLFAIKKCDEFLAEPSLENLKPQFLINKGTAFTYLQKYSKAIEMYEEALEFNVQLPIIYTNLFRAWYNKYKIAIDNQKDYPIIPIVLLRYLNNARVNLDKFKTLKLNAKDKEKFSKFKNEENQFNVDLNSFYEYCLKGLNINDIPIFLALVALIEDEYLTLIYKANSDSIKSLTEKEPNEISSDNWNYLAIFFKDINRNDLALIAINKGLKKINEMKDSFALSDTKGEILYNLGNYEEAFNFFNLILEVNEDDLRVSYFYAETCWKAAKTAKELGKLEIFEELRTKSLKLIETHCKDEKVKKKILEEFSQ
ncbi:hypothetical protein LCGC14_0780200 [marine sediment metagenome]|uniref:Tetratricopeptide repeat protein n=1 Tax=marine sediment metagenome TaxID=412755 RepID=A0A0F9PVZ9_9ZZZZ